MRPNGSSLFCDASKCLPLAVETFALAEQERDRSERVALDQPDPSEYFSACGRKDLRRGTPKEILSHFVHLPNRIFTK